VIRPLTAAFDQFMTASIPTVVFVARVWIILACAAYLGCLAAKAAPVPRDEAPPAGSPQGGSDDGDRVPWTTSRVLGSPDPPPLYQVTRVFPGLKFKAPVDLSAAPGSDRLFLADQAGQVHSFKSDGSGSDLCCDLTNSIAGVSALYGITFHPGFATNRQVYLCYVLQDGNPEGSRVSRFTMSSTEPPTIDLASERVIITWLAGGHNGGCIKFGLDGYLYISTGDGAGPDPPDPLQTGQSVSDLLSAVLRIDVDHQDGQKPYAVPSDNPFLGRPEARPEVWAYGLRNPWRMSFDRQTGALWVADVGWELWEMVYRVERGGNYGWSIVEGPQSIHPDGKRGPTPILSPLKAHPHSEAASITGGFVYHGSKLPQLAGVYIYGDWVTGKIWALRSEQNLLISVDELVDTPLQVVCFAEDQAGELLVVDYGGGIYRLEANTQPSTQLVFPRRLSETGLFESVSGHQLARGVIPFQVNAEMWNDYGTAERFIGLPGHSRIETGATNVWVYQSKNEWRYPTNAVLGRTFSIQMEHGNPRSARRLETQLLHFDGREWHAYTYRWDEAQSDAALVDAGGDELTLNARDASAPEGHRQQVWRFPSRSECLRCHNPWVNVALAFTGSQLNRPVPAGLNSGSTAGGEDSSGPGGDVNQLVALSRLSCFDQPMDERVKPRFNSPYDASAELNERARCWLHVNCSHCHREGAGGSVVSHFDYDTPLRDMKALGQMPSQGNLGLTNAHVITPGDPCSSVLYYRIATTGQGRMPLIGSRFVDTRGLQLLHDWIATLPLGRGANHQADGPVSLSDEDREAARCVARRAAGCNIPAALDRLLSSPNGSLALLSALNVAGASCPPELPRVVAQHSAFQVRDLFERFLPEKLRPAKLGLNTKPEQILALRGDPQEGRKAFFREAVQCSTCHRIAGQGRNFGPELSRIGRKYEPAQLLDQILNPSKTIDPAFVTYQVQMKDNESYAGLILKRSADELLLKDGNLREVRIPMADVKSVQAQQLSTMPEGLLQSLTAQDAADLVAFLSSLK
jgi:putative heme-binding domain-containing protein